MSLVTQVTTPRRTEVLGVETFVGTFADATDAVVERARSRAGGYVVQCNVHVLMTAHKDPEVRRALDDAWLVMPDGAPVAWLQRRQGAAVAERVAGPDLMPSVIGRGLEHGLRHFFLGSTPGILDALVARVEDRFAGVEIAGSHSLSFASLLELETTSDIAAATAPDVIWLALGAPKQELWMYKHADKLAPSLVIGVGAAFGFHAGVRSRAPAWVQRRGLEWAHRLIAEPRRLTGRYVKTNSAFIARAGISLARRRLKL